MQRSSVVLPEPLGPMIETFSPRKTVEIDAGQNLELAKVLVQVDNAEKGSLTCRSRPFHDS